MKFTQLTLALLALLAWSSFADAHPTVGLSIRIGPPGHYGHGHYHYHPYPYRYAHPYPYLYPYAYAPAVVVVGSSPAPAPVLVETAPTVQAVPASAPSIIPVNNYAPTRMDTLLQQLSDPSETVRRDAAMDLGRMKAQRAVDPLMTMLAKDSSPLARDGAARALGLIGSSRSLTSLIYAAQADNDRDVRHSAQFAVEIIRTNLRGN